MSAAPEWWDQDDEDAEARARLIDLLASCHASPALFNTAILGRHPYWWRQEEIAQSLVRYRDTVAYSGNAIGKDYLVGGIVPWWLYTRANSLVIVTGPGQSLLGSVTWKEIRRAVDGSRVPLGCRISQGIKASPLTVKVAEGWQALGFSTTSIERASGQHAGQLLVIVEEASGLEDEQWAALRGLKYTRLLAIGNPIRAEGEFVKLIRQAERDKADGVDPALAVNAIHVPSTDSPHATWDHSPFGLADRTWIEAEMRRYGKDSLWVRSHIHALVPAVSFENLIPRAWLEWAASDETRPKEPPSHPRRRARRISVDLGEGVGRDSSGVMVRDWLQVLSFRGGSGMGLAEAANACRELSERFCVPHSQISYDKLGIGRNFHQHLARVGITEARPYFGNGDPKSPQFTNLRTECAWTARNRLDPDWSDDPGNPAFRQQPFHIGRGEYYERLEKELTALTYDLVGKQTRLISKEDLMTKLGHSPDYGDTFCQSFAF